MKVDFMIIGAGRSGTTTIYKYLERHKEVNFSTIKEVHYFSIDSLYQRGTQYFHSFFDKKNEKSVPVAADTYLFIDHQAIERIYEYNPNMKFLVMLRKPVDRAFSGYNYAVNNGYLNKNISFLEAIEKETEILQNSTIQDKNNLCNAYQSLYCRHLDKWTEFFPKENFLLLKTSELKNEPQNLLHKISEFLKISEFETMEEIKANSAKAVKSKRVEQLLLNRDSFSRKIIRNVTPRFVKNMIFKSGVVDKIHSLNKSDVEIRQITENEHSTASKLFTEDLENLRKNYNICFE